MEFQEAQATIDASLERVWAVLEAIAGRELLVRCYAAALDQGYLWHELGDSHLILP